MSTNKELDLQLIVEAEEEEVAMLRLTFKNALFRQSTVGAFNMLRIEAKFFLRRSIHATNFLLKDKPFNPNSGSSTPRKSKFASKKAAEQEETEDEDDDSLEDEEEDEGKEESKKGGRSEEEKRKLEEKRKARELKKKETRLRQLDIQKKRNEAKKPKKSKPIDD